MGGKSWHAIKKLINPPFLILKVRHPAVTGVYCIVRDSRSGCSNDFKCTRILDLLLYFIAVNCLCMLFSSVPLVTDRLVRLNLLRFSRVGSWSTMSPGAR